MGHIDVNYRAVVDRTGAIYLPKVGPITVTGVRYDQLNTYIKTAISRVYKNFDLDVTLGRLRAVQVFVVGEAASRLLHRQLVKYAGKCPVCVRRPIEARVNAAHFIEAPG